MDKKIRINQKFNIMEFEYPFAEKMNPLLEKEIRDSGDVQNRETLCKCDMTDLCKVLTAVCFIRQDSRSYGCTALL